MTINACLAPGLAPGRVRLVRLAEGGTELEILAEMAPDLAEKLATSLQTAAAVARAEESFEGGKMLRLWACTDHDTYYPVGGASIVVAADEETARRYLRNALELRKLKGDKFTLQEIDLSNPKATILNDGEY